MCSVCIANYNGEQIIDQCIDSILHQNEYADSVEIIIHDDASTDNSVAVIKDKYPQARVLCSETNVGFCESNNLMVAIARGQYVLLLNNDAALWPDALSVLVRQAQSQRCRGILTLPQYDWQSREIVDRGCLLDPFYTPVPNLDPQRTDIAMAIGACLWLPRSLWNELGGFPAWMESIAEDVYLCCLARFRGYPVQVTATSGYWHMQGKSFGGNRAQPSGLVSTYRRRMLSERNRSYVSFLFAPSYLVWGVMVLNFFFLFSEGMVLSLLKWNKKIFLQIYLNVLSSVLRSRLLLLGERARVQKSRLSSFASFFSVFTLCPRKFSLLLRYGIPSLR